MSFRKNLAVILLLLVLLLSGCAMRTVDQMYAVPKRSSEYQDLQRAIDTAMGGLEYWAPLSGENRQTVQMADLDGDAEAEYLLFAKGNSDDPLKIFIFDRQGSEYALRQTIQSRGTAFEQVEYVDMDGIPGKELIVGLRVSDQVLRYAMVYSFSRDASKLLLAVNYSKFVTVDLNQDNLVDLMVISPGPQEEDSAVASLYYQEKGSIVRSVETKLSAKSENIKRIMVSKLHGGVPAVYVASALEESTIITDVFSVRDGRFLNVSLSNDSGTSVKTLRNYYVYADDIDSDGTLELPSLIDMEPVQNNIGSATRHLIRWYAMTEQGEEVDKAYTFHNFDGGWYVTLNGEWAPRVSVTQDHGTCTFYVWDENFEKAEKLLTLYSYTGSNRDLEAQQAGRIVLYKSDSTTYAVQLEVASLSYGVSEENLRGCFHLIHLDWKSGET